MVLGIDRFFFIKGIDFCSLSETGGAMTCSALGAHTTGYWKPMRSQKDDQTTGRYAHRLEIPSQVTQTRRRPTKLT